VHRLLDDDADVPAGRALDRLADHLSATESASTLAERADRERRVFEHVVSLRKTDPRRQFAGRVLQNLPHGSLVELDDLGTTALWRHRGHKPPALGARAAFEIDRLDAERQRFDVRLARNGSRSKPSGNRTTGRRGARRSTAGRATSDSRPIRR
jgi:hypothetical protein